MMVILFYLHTLHFGFADEWQCVNYTSIDDPTRGTNWGGSTECDVYDDSIEGDVWYRFVAADNGMIPTFVPEYERCYTYIPGWQDYSNPTTIYDTSSGRICYRSSGVSCSLAGSATTMLCDGFFIYKIEIYNVCYARICTTNYDGPTLAPSRHPTPSPTAPTIMPTIMPTTLPTTIPTTMPTRKPSNDPTTMPTIKPTTPPTVVPSVSPTESPTTHPTSHTVMEAILQPTYVLLAAVIILLAIVAIILYCIYKKMNQKMNQVIAGVKGLQPDDDRRVIAVQLNDDQKVSAGRVSQETRGSGTPV